MNQKSRVLPILIAIAVGGSGIVMLNSAAASSVDTNFAADPGGVVLPTPTPSVGSDPHDFSLDTSPITSVPAVQLTALAGDTAEQRDTAEQTAIPLPAPVWTGLGGLAGLAVVRSGRFVRWFLG